MIHWLITLTVLLPVTQGQFLWIKQPSNRTVYVGSDVYMPCEYSGVSALPLWRRNGEVFDPNHDPPPQHYGNATGLIIADVDSSNNMTWYSCFFDLFSGARESTVGYIIVLSLIEAHDQTVSRSELLTSYTYETCLSNLPTNLDAYTSASVQPTLVISSHNISDIESNPTAKHGPLFILVFSPLVAGVLWFIIFVAITIAVLRRRRKLITQAPDPAANNVLHTPEPIYEQILNDSKIVSSASVWIQEDHSQDPDNIMTTECPAYQL